MENTATLSSKYQITIPSAVRKLVGLRAGDRLVYGVRNNQIYIKKPEPLEDISDRISSYIKPGTPPLENASEFYQTRRPRI
jgi:AbrB family looped-hinge helix DNA binding protein